MNRQLGVLVLALLPASIRGVALLVLRRLILVNPVLDDGKLVVGGMIRAGHSDEVLPVLDECVETALARAAGDDVSPDSLIGSQGNSGSRPGGPWQLWQYADTRGLMSLS